MKIKGFHNYAINKFIQQINFWGMFISIYLLYLLGNPYYIFMSIASIILITKIGHTIGMHRYFCHRSFKTSTIKEWLMAGLATLSTTSSIVYYSGIHRYHHMNSDNDNDVHDPKRLGFIKSFFFLINSKDLSGISTNLIKDLVKNKRVMFFHNWYWPVIISYISILYIIDPYLVLFCYVLPAGYSKFIAGVQSTFLHTHGYRNFNTPDNSKNNIFWNWLTLGEGLHNNHHKYPNEYSHDYTKKKYEFDIAGKFIKYFLIEK